MLDLQIDLDIHWVEMFRDLDAVMRTGNARYLLTGGNAREILLVNVYGCEAGRATTDLDFGLLVSDWEQFETLKQSMVSSGSFSKTSVQHRMIYSGSEVPLFVDLIPFGEVAGPGGILQWPPDYNTEMLVLGFEQALECAIEVKVDPSFTLPIASIEGLAILKLIAWIDNGLARDGKDASDLRDLLINYERVLGDALYDEYDKTVRSYNFDTCLAASHILGLRVSSCLSQALKDLFHSYLASDHRDSLLSYMQHRQAIDWDEIDQLLRAFEKGMDL